MSNPGNADVQEEFPAEYVIRCLESSKVFIFSKSWCPLCAKAKSLLRRFRVSFTSSELDLRPDGNNILEHLREKTGSRTVPNIFINKIHIGGLSDLHKICMAGILPDVLSGDYKTFDYDLIVIGGGSGGLSAVKAAAEMSQKVALFDFVTPTPLGTKWGLGGTCVNVGCIPKKLMHRGSLIYHDLLDAAHYGWNVPDVTPEEHDWGTLIENIQNYVKSLNYSYRKEMKEYKVDYFNMYVSFQDKHTVVAQGSGETKTFTARCIIIAVGCRPLYLDLPGVKELCISSDDLFSLAKQPKKVLIIGASYIALECGGFLRGLGCDVTVMVRSRLLRNFDRDMSERLGNIMTELGVKFVMRCGPTGFEKAEGDGLIIAKGKMESGETFEGTFDTVLLAVGRQAITQNLNLEKIGVKTDPKNNRIRVDKWDRTAAQNVFAIGDVASGVPELTPVAIKAGKLLAMRLFSPKESKLMDYTIVPTTVFTPLEYACVGLSEEAAHDKYKGEIEVFHHLRIPLEFSLSRRFGRKDCYAKLICAKRDDDKIMKVVGIHILSPNAGEVIQGYAMGLALGATKDNFDDLVGIHPTVAEVFTNLSITKSSESRSGNMTIPVAIGWVSRAVEWDFHG